MSDRALLLEIAGFLRLVKDGFPASREEAAELLEKIGAALNEPTPEPAIASKLRDLADAILKTPSISRDEVVERLRLVADDSFPRGNEIPPRKLTEERDGGGTWPTR
jgi:hypothetical protein